MCIGQTKNNVAKLLVVLRIKKKRKKKKSQWNNANFFFGGGLGFTLTNQKNIPFIYIDLKA